jgi:TolB-like protein/Tfp pilus assembly protein PilF
VALAKPESENFIGQAMAEDLTTALAKYRWLSVTALNAQTGGNGAALDLQNVARDLGAEYAVEGSLRQGDDRLRLTIHLIDLESRKYLWVQRYDRDIENSLSMQDELVETIAATVESELTSVEGERARHVDNKNMSAWDCYHLGLSIQYEFGKESNATAQELFRRAIEMDPNFGAAYARLSYALVISTIYFEADQTSGLLDEALELARKATRIDDQDAIAQFALGRAHLARGEYERSLVALETATKLNPTMAQAFCGLGDSLAYAGRLEESVSQFEEAVRLSPNDPYRWAFLMYGAVAHLFMKDFEKAADWGGQATRVPNSHYWANAVQVAALGHLNQMSEAEKARTELLRLNPRFTCAFAKDRLFYLRIAEQRDLYIEGLKKAGVPD